MSFSNFACVMNPENKYSLNAMVNILANKSFYSGVPQKTRSKLVTCCPGYWCNSLLRPWGGVRPFFTESFILYRIVKPYSGEIQNSITELHSLLGSQVMTQNVNVFGQLGRVLYIKLYMKNGPKLSLKWP